MWARHALRRVQTEIRSHSLRAWYGSFANAQALGYGTFGAGGFFGDSEKAACSQPFASRAGPVESTSDHMCRPGARRVPTSAPCLRSFCACGYYRKTKMTQVWPSRSLWSTSTASEPPSILSRQEILAKAHHARK